MSEKRFDDAGLDYRDLQTRDYSGYFMLSNPFPSIPVAEREPRVFIDRESIMNEVANVTKDSFNTGRSQTLIMQGDYGNGKSHALRYIKSRINTQLATQTGKRAIAAYVQSPGGDIKYLLASLIEDLGVDFLQAQSFFSLAGFFNAHPDRMKYVIGPQSQRANARQVTLPADIVILKRDLHHDKFMLRSMVDDFIDSLKIKSPDFARVFFQLAEDEISGLAWRWLLGEDLSRQDRTLLGVNSNIEASDDALNAFATLKVLLGTNDTTVIYVLLDEFEKVAEVPNVRARSRYFDDLRHLIDQNETGLCLIACVTPTGWAYIRGSGHPLARRLLGNVHWLESFRPNEIERLIVAYATLARQEYFQRRGKSEVDYTTELKGRKANPDLFPFTESAISFLYDLTKGNVSEVLRLCKKLIDSGCDRNYPVFDSPEIVSKILGVPIVESPAS